MNITTIGIDLAKTSFSLAGSDRHGKIVLCKTLLGSRGSPCSLRISGRNERVAEILIRLQARVEYLCDCCTKYFYLIVLGAKHQSC